MTVDKNIKKINALFDEIASYYDKMNNFISFGTQYFIKKSAISKLNIKKSSRVLDLACGTGDIVKIASSIECEIIGLDISNNMLEIAKEKNPEKEFILGDILSLPFSDFEFNYAIITFGLRNVENRTRALSEINRILKKGGKFLHLDFGEHNFFSKIFDYFTPLIVKIFKVKKDNYNYLIQSKNEYPEPNELIEEFKKAGFRLVNRKDYLFGAISAQIMEKI
ncbi:ubiquinone/menaquinone biosynthesis methyltransferase [bacterium]|nr:ubiquinone/menaquinone biosynthesis methyltransferase [bacterium]